MWKYIRGPHERLFKNSNRHLECRALLCSLYPVIALVSKRKKGSLTQKCMPLKIKLVFDVIWTESSNDLLPLKVPLWQLPPHKNSKGLTKVYTSMISTERLIVKDGPIDLSMISVGKFFRAYRIISPGCSHSNEYFFP